MDALHYRFVVQGELGPLYTSAFEGMRVECAGGRSTIIGQIDDQSQLQGMLARIASLGLALISVSPIDP